MMTAIRKALLFTLLLMSLCAGAARVAMAAESGVSSTLAVSGYVRETLPGLSTSAAYLELANRAAAGRQLVLVEVSAMGIDNARASLHITEVRDGISRMRPLAQLAIAAGQTVQMSPGGLHVMLEGVQLRAGDMLSLRLRFASGETREVRLPVRSLQGQKSHHHHSHG
ncbi:hypothetical protein Maes01_02373 [Microbulbifer aestuariivivens]|uniref:Copper chaperone PCu(A)C n=1 Tax=Microbulbifer aestuariivivens TaxID=1908308 RepID=A0ABP9WRG8_9GAMM